MDERYIPAAAGEARPISGVERGDSAGAADAADTAAALSDPRALQILTTEHWSLLTARSLVYNEAFARSGMFLSFLAATLVVLGLVSTATGFSDSFLAIAAVILSLDLFVGYASLGRVAFASREDIRYLQGMNRLRHAYHEMVPGLGPYFITSHHDDFRSVVSFYGPASMGLRGVIRGMTTTPGMLGVICSAVTGGLAAVLALLATHDVTLSATSALVAFVLSFVITTLTMVRSVLGFGASFLAMFPRDSEDDRPGF